MFAVPPELAIIRHLFLAFNMLWLIVLLTAERKASLTGPVPKLDSTITGTVGLFTKSSQRQCSD